MALGVGDITFGAATAFLFGVLAVTLGWNIQIVFMVAVLFAFGFLLFVKKLFLWKEFLFFAVAMAFGAFYYHFYLDVAASKINLTYNRFVSFSAVVTDEPQPSQKVLILTVNARLPLDGEIKIFAPPTSDFRYGDMLQINGIITMPDGFGGDPIVFSPQIRTISRHKGFWLREKLIDCKLAILKNFEAVLPNDEAALLGGIAFGSKVNFSAELKNAMALSSTTHLVAVSGYNITIVILAAEGVFGQFCSRRKTVVFSVILIMLFVLMTGLQPSAIRAAITGFIALFARETGRVFNIRNAIALAAAIMVLWNPTMLAGNAGFELSFLSLTGIVYLGPALKKLFHYGNAGFLDWKECGITTLSAQLAVMPVLVITFGQFSATAIFANILILATVPLAMFFGFLLAMFGFVSYYLAFFCAKLVGLILFYELAMIRLFAGLSVPVPINFNATATLLAYYAILAFFAAANFNKYDEKT
jgi:competence protein ComEC